MNEINFYNALSSDLSALLNQTKNIVSNEEFVYVNQKVSRIQYLIQIQMQGRLLLYSIYTKQKRRPLKSSLFFDFL